MPLEYSKDADKEYTRQTCSFLNSLLLLLLLLFKKCQDSNVYAQNAENMPLDYTKGTVLL
jgi:hypothetical protein